MMKKEEIIRYVYEFIGTFFLVLTVGMVALDSRVGLWAPLAIGSILAVMVYAGGHISGGHYNPAVSLAVFIRKKLTLDDLWKYWIAQVAGGVVAALLTLYLKGGPADHPLELHIVKAFLVEFLFTFALCYVVLNVAAANATAGNSYFGWAIGFTVLAGAYAIGTISSAALNPAVAIGVTILNLSNWTNLWVYIVATLLGGAAAAFVFHEAHPHAR
jgi:aquaporin Z